jgi:actin-related protein 8
VRDSYAADAEEKRDAAVKYATSAINKQKKKGKAAAGGGGNAFFDEVKTVQVYNQQNCTTRIPMHQDLDWNWTSVREEGVLVGDQVNAIPMQYSNRYSLFYPIRHGRLNVVQGEDGIGSTRRALDALEDIFKVIVKKVMPKAKSASEEEDNDDHEDEDDTRLSKYAVVLVIPDSFSKRETLDLVSLLLDRIGFGAVGLHLESVLSCFGAGVSSACVLDIGAQKTIVSCVKDGIVVPNSV